MATRNYSRHYNRPAMCLGGWLARRAATARTVFCDVLEKSRESDCGVNIGSHVSVNFCTILRFEIHLLPLLSEQSTLFNEAISISMAPLTKVRLRYKRHRTREKRWVFAPANMQPQNDREFLSMCSSNTSARNGQFGGMLGCATTFTNFSYYNNIFVWYDLCRS